MTTVGAGDAFNGALAASLAVGLSLVEAATRANAAAAIAVTKPGAQGALPSRAEIDRMVAGLNVGWRRASGEPHHAGLVGLARGSETPQSYEFRSRVLCMG